jgi:hydroxymethylpyrimidine/phosphomethylpyrimidine kinase
MTRKARSGSKARAGARAGAKSSRARGARAGARASSRGAAKAGGAVKAGSKGAAKATAKATAKAAARPATRGSAAHQPRSRPRPLVPLSIAGSDPGGGAGLQADLKVFLRFGLSGAAVPTAVTVQSPTGVRSVQGLTGALIGQQLAVLLADVRPAAVKVGLLADADAVRAVARALAPLARLGIPIVVDPVLAASDGTRFLPKDAVPVLLRHLVPLATLLTPNIAEAAELAGVEESVVHDEADRVVNTLLETGARAVLIKGGHGSGEEATDVLGTRRELVLYSLQRVPGRRTVHGTGCALSAAITALLARGIGLPEAVQGAKEFVTQAIAGARHIGRGARQLDFLVSSEPGADEERAERDREAAGDER